MTEARVAPIKKALISVSDKTGVVPFAQALEVQGVGDVVDARPVAGGMVRPRARAGWAGESGRHKDAFLHQ